MVYLFAVLAALANALGSVLERKAAATTSDEDLSGLRLVRVLFRQPIWFAGVGALICGFLFQVLALEHGRVGVVQPVLVIELPFTLVLAALAFRQSAGTTAWLGAGAMSAGLGLLLFFGDPSGGSRMPNPQLWIITLGAAGGGMLLIVLLALRMHSGRRGALLAVAAGAGFGITAVVMKGATEQLSEGVRMLLGSWQLYLMMAIGTVSFYLFQRALQAAPLAVVQPGVTICDPVVAVACGAVLFGDYLRTGWYLLPEFIGGLALACGVVVLSRSPLINEQVVDEGDEALVTDGAPAAVPLDRASLGEPVHHRVQPAQAPQSG